MKASTLLLILTLFLILVAIITNPKEENHKSAVKAQLGRLMTDKISEVKEFQGKGAGFAGLGLMMANSIVETMVDSHVQVDNYLLFSLTKVVRPDETVTIGYGAFGNVYLTDELNQGVLDKIGESR